MFPGSKNVHIAIRDRADLALYSDSRFLVARNVGEALCALLETMTPAARERLLRFLAITKYTATFELLQPSYQHVTLLEGEPKVWEKKKRFCINLKEAKDQRYFFACSFASSHGPPHGSIRRPRCAGSTLCWAWSWHVISASAPWPIKCCRLPNSTAASPKSALGLLHVKPHHL